MADGVYEDGTHPYQFTLRLAPTTPSQRETFLLALQDLVDAYDAVLLDEQGVVLLQVRVPAETPDAP